MLDGLDRGRGAAVTGDAIANVRFELDVAGIDARWVVQSVSLQEAVNEPLRGVIDTLVPGDAPAARELLGKAVTLRIERGDELRTVRGIVRQASIGRVHDDARITLQLVSSLWRLSLGMGSRVHQDLTVPELVQRVIRDSLGDAVEVDVEGLTQNYEIHEMLVQYQEPALAFLTRWLEQEGIFYYFEDGYEGERIVLADAMESLPFARDREEGRVPCWGDPTLAHGAEHVADLRASESLGVTKVALSGFDWTHPTLDIRAEREDQSPLSPPCEIYDHADAVTMHLFDSWQYNHNTATRNAQVRSEAAALSRQRWTARASVVTAMPGHVLRIEGAPDGDLDGAYMIVRCESAGHPHEGGMGSWKSSLVLVPTALPYRPARITPRPVVPGPETAFVVGPSGQEIETDRHGRVKVHFHWDRVNAREDENSSCWIRVAQSWAGDGFGTFFLPRIGMEVVVEFLGGDPDRPLVTGCVHNGASLARVDLPAQKTQSYIRTRSSQDSDGYNEIRFEDHAGAEFISVHAQRNLLERVLHDHRTHVGHDQRDEVDNDQELIVHQNRTKTVEQNENNTVKGERFTVIGEEGGHDILHCHHDHNERIDGSREVKIRHGDTLEVHGARRVMVDEGLTSLIARGVDQTITSGGWTMTTTGDVTHDVTGSMLQTVQGTSTLRTLGSIVNEANGAFSASGSQITLRSRTSVNVMAPGGIQNITPTREENVLTESYHTVQQLVESVSGKLAAYTMAITLSAMKVDLSGLKIDLYGKKIDNSSFKAKKSDVSIDNSLTVNIQIAAIILIG